MTTLHRQRGTIVTNIIRHKRVSFFVENENDSIQSCQFAGRFYEEEELAIIEKYFDPGSYFIDIGANVGNHTIYASLYLDAAQIIPFEVNPDAIRMLRTNIRLNNLANVDESFIGLGLAGRDCRMELIHLMPNNLGGAGYQARDAGGFPAVAGDSVLAPLPVRFIKLDVEQMEIDVLLGLSMTINRWRPNMFIECVQAKLKEFLQLMEIYRYSIVATFDRYEGIGNYMVLPKEKL
jgi:FkbM family methyltransferase